MKLLHVFALIPTVTTAFVTTQHQPSSVISRVGISSSTPIPFNINNNRKNQLQLASTTDDDVFEITVMIPPSGSGLQADMKIPKLLSVPSEIIEVRYKLPFGLDVAPQKNFAVCTKDGSGGEKVGDILRYTSAWSLGLPQGDGLLSTAASFSGGVSWQCSLFNVMKAKNWDQVVEALTSNVEQRTDEVVLIFERPLEPAPELA